MDDEIRAFIERERKETQAFLEAWDKRDPSLFLEQLSVKMWFAGLKKYGKKWSDREYELQKEYEKKV